MTDEKKMSQKTIQNYLESIEKMNGFLQELLDKTSRDNTTLKLGDQLRPTEDYNGSLFEVVREPYWCYIGENGRANEMIVQRKEVEFAEEGAQAKDFVEILEKRRVDVDGYEPGVLYIELKQGVERKYEGTPFYDDYDDEDEKEDENGRYYIEIPVYTVVYSERILPAGWTPERRVWVRKICIISKAEGHTDDKNLRSLPFPLATIPFRNLIDKELTKLNKVSRNLQATRPGAKRVSKTSMRSRNEAKCRELIKLWADPTISERPVSGFYSEKYGLFLKSDIRYIINTRFINPGTKLIDDVAEIKSQAEADGKNVQGKV